MALLQVYRTHGYRYSPHHMHTQFIQQSGTGQKNDQIGREVLNLRWPMTPKLLSLLDWIAAIAQRQDRGRRDDCEARGYASAPDMVLMRTYSEQFYCHGELIAILCLQVSSPRSAGCLVTAVDSLSGSLLHQVASSGHKPAEYVKRLPVS